MTCPNRDGTIGTGGCIFCDEGGSGDFAIPYEGQKIETKDLIWNHQKAEPGDYIAYFQSYTNTYAPVERLRFLFFSALRDPMFAGISIATRPDCLSESVLDVLAEMKKAYPDKFIWVELGLQSMHESTAAWMRRGYPLQVYDDALAHLHTLHIPVVTHVILGFSQETPDMVYETIRHLNAVHTDGVKLQLLHYLKGTDLGRMYEAHPEAFHVLSEEEYVKLVVQCIGRLDSQIVINRLTGDGNPQLLLAPLWSLNKRHVLNQITHELKAEGIRQGCLL